jgi:chromosome segregation ATPase
MKLRSLFCLALLSSACQTAEPFNFDNLQELSYGAQKQSLYRFTRQHRADVPFHLPINSFITIAQEINADLLQQQGGPQLQAPHQQPPLAQAIIQHNAQPVQAPLIPVVDNALNPQELQRLNAQLNRDLNQVEAENQRLVQAQRTHTGEVEALQRQIRELEEATNHLQATLTAREQQLDQTRRAPNEEVENLRQQLQAQEDSARLTQRALDQQQQDFQQARQVWTTKGEEFQQRIRELEKAGQDAQQALTEQRQGFQKVSQAWEREREEFQQKIQQLKKAEQQYIEEINELERRVQRKKDSEVFGNLELPDVLKDSAPTSSSSSSSSSKTEVEQSLDDEVSSNAEVPKRQAQESGKEKKRVEKSLALTLQDFPDLRQDHEPIATSSNSSTSKTEIDQAPLDQVTSNYEDIQRQIAKLEVAYKNKENTLKQMKNPASPKKNINHTARNKIKRCEAELGEQQKKLKELRNQLASFETTTP